MFLTLLAVTLLLSTTVAWTVSRAFSRPIERILSRIIADGISAAWLQYMKFAILSSAFLPVFASMNWSATSPRRSGRKKPRSSR